MSSPTPRQKVVIVGAGPVGALAALYAASRGDEVEVYELRGGTCSDLSWSTFFIIFFFWHLCNRDGKNWQQIFACMSYCATFAVGRKAEKLHSATTRAKRRSLERIAPPDEVRKVKKEKETERKKMKARLFQPY